MPILIQELLNALPDDTEDRVKNAKDRFNNRVRESLRRETRFAFRRRNGGDREDTVNVPIAVKPGLPEPLLPTDKQQIDEAHRIPIMLAPFQQSLAALRDGAKLASEQLLPLLQKEATAAPLLDGREDSIARVYDYAEFLLEKLSQFELTEFILRVDSDVLGVYRYPATRLWDDPEPRIELYWGIIGLVARDLGVAAEDLTIVVLAHELAHAYTHVGTDANENRWSTPGFQASEHSLKEGLAQYYTRLVCNRFQRDAPGALLIHQPEAYFAHEEWQDAKPEHVRLAMLQIRGLKNGATLQQFKISLAMAVEQIGL